ncbi:Gfo/Idh/MocA family oxidoreductase [Variovorax sp. PCZ-1]|uniref:Gfo/Idh/MocA family protein n=1 Tax=Variovorax sp. PCZ-1 TaxID=2835533 RepID=UPI001BCEB0BC|nr:Gfo/Idh/MocA family oxidoreductase [Variovorax sp. PCZ-1]MBS7808880.1 Gfo/Idh/MocA family oxidoreductase [Variovorax sp. PCZ-1]
MNTSQLPPLRIGILSTARIADEFCEGNLGNPRIRIAAVGSLSADTARAFAKKHGITRSYASYEALLADSQIDAVYIPLPNHLHAPWAIAAAKAGKHVLCEKPLAMTRAEAQAMFDAAQEADVMLLEGYPYWFQPHLRQVLDWVQGGSVGSVRSLSAHFSFPMVNRANDIRARAETGGGATGDVGCYVVSLAQLVMGRMPRTVHAVPVWSHSDVAKRVDMSMAITMDYEDGAVVHLLCGMNQSYRRAARICGDQGVIETSFPNHTAGHRSVQNHTNDIHPTLWRGPMLTEAAQATPQITANGFYLEAQKFADIVQTQDKSAIAQAKEVSLAVATVLDAVRQSANSGQRVEL